jgi:cytochrome c oxidase subunit 1
VIDIPWLGISATPLDLNVFISWSVWLLGIVQIPFIINFFWSMVAGKKAESDNPWHATTLDWQTPTPPPHGNFVKPIRVYREAYEYSVPGWPEDFTPQNAPPREDQQDPEAATAAADVEETGQDKPAPAGAH